MSGKTREQQLDELLDKQAIYELIMAYCNIGGNRGCARGFCQDRLPLRRFRSRCALRLQRALIRDFP